MCNCRYLFKNSAVFRVSNHFNMILRRIHNSLFDLGDTYEKWEQTEVYCRGRLLHDVQMSRIYKDSKTFVDKKLNRPANVTIQKYDDLKMSYPYTLPPKEIIKQFIDENFTDGNEFESWTPTDWVPEPAIVKKVQDPGYKKLVIYLNEMWKDLARKVKDDVKLNPNLYSIFYLPHGFIIPGGRFRELYYWDTYWIVSGLLVCDMVKTAKGIIENFLYLVDELGYIPNGTRVYYLKRSQPPLLSSIVDRYLRATGDLDFLHSYIHLLEKETEFWLNERLVEFRHYGETFRMFRYCCRVPGPRPESYWEDLYTVSGKPMAIEEKAEALTGIKSAAESGWDFSSRWYLTESPLLQSNIGSLVDTRAQFIIPVDLNALLHKNFCLLSTWHHLLGNGTKSDSFRKLAEEQLYNIQTILWRMGQGMWCDFDLKHTKSREFWYASNVFPLWTRSYTTNRRDLTKTILRYIDRLKLDVYEGSMPTSIENSRQQWDFPNVWAPLIGVLAHGLDSLGTPCAHVNRFDYINLKFISDYSKNHPEAIGC